MKGRKQIKDVNFAKLFVVFTLLFEKKSILLQRHDKYPNKCQTI